MRTATQLLLYGNAADQEVRTLAGLAEAAGRAKERGEVHPGPEADKMRVDYYRCLHTLIETAENLGFEGNLWHCYLTWRIVYDENAYSRACEIRGSVEGSVGRSALHDMEIFMDLFAADFEGAENWLGIGDALFETLTDYEPAKSDKRIFNRRIRDRICDLAEKLGNARDAAAFKEQVDRFYGDFGAGVLGLHKAFRVEHAEGSDVRIVPITNIAHVKLDDLVGYERAKQMLVENTEAFVSGRPANNCLLYGDAGTGKSSSIKGILNQYYDRGLRMIEIYRHQFRDLNAVISQIKNRNYRFIIYMDDLSFEDFETEYKYLKAVIEGGLEKKPDNILIYATSNRRHLIRENYSDKGEGASHGDMHASDTVQEKLSLAARFGVSIYFGSPDKKEFGHIVEVLARRSGIEMDPQQLLLAADQWELYHGGRSGRTAQQFIDHLTGTQEE